LEIFTANFLFFFKKKLYKAKSSEELEFKNIEVERKSHSDQIVEDWISGIDINKYIYSAYIRAEK